MKYRKSIAYAYQTSTNADTLGDSGFHIEEYALLESGDWSVPYIPQQCQGDVFERMDDPDLIALFIDRRGEPIYIHPTVASAITKATARKLIAELEADREERTNEHQDIDDFEADLIESLTETATR